MREPDTFFSTTSFPRWTNSRFEDEFFTQTHECDIYFILSSVVGTTSIVLGVYSINEMAIDYEISDIWEEYFNWCIFYFELFISATLSTTTNSVGNFSRLHKRVPTQSAYRPPHWACVGFINYCLESCLKKAFVCCSAGFLRFPLRKAVFQRSLGLKRVFYPYRYC